MRRFENHQPVYDTKDSLSTNNLQFQSSKGRDYKKCYFGWMEFSHWLFVCSLNGRWSASNSRSRLVHGIKPPLDRNMLRQDFTKFPIQNYRLMIGVGLVESVICQDLKTTHYQEEFQGTTFKTKTYSGIWCWVATFEINGPA